MKILVVGECAGPLLSPFTHSVVAAARAMGDDVSVLVFGGDCREPARQAARIEGVGAVIVADQPAYGNHATLLVTELVEHAGRKFTHIIGAHNGIARDVLPGVAARLDVDMVSDVTAVYGPNRFRQPVCSGRFNVDVQVEAPYTILTIRAGAFDPAGEQQEPAPLHVTEFLADSRTVELVEEKNGSTGPDLQTASLVVGGGRGIGSKDDFDRLRLLAQRLGGAVGASMGAIEAGLASYDIQIGQTGQTVAPELYIAAGISGSPYHLAGIRDSKVILAINNDPDAPIFEAVDYGLVGDLTQLLPGLAEKLGCSSSNPKD